MKQKFEPGRLVSLRGRDWVVLPSDSPELLIVRPLGGSDDEIAGIYLPLNISDERPQEARFPPPSSEDLGDISRARYLYDSARLAFRNGSGPFRSMAKLSFRPRAYQIVPLVMALRQDTVRLLIADDVGVGKTVEALLILREMLERSQISRFAVICLPHLCDQWQKEIREKLDIEAVIIRSNTQARLDRMIQGDMSVYDYYPYQIISIDYIKSDVRKNVFLAQCPELVIVDEAHTCAKPAGTSAGQHQRHDLVRRISANFDRHLILLTATPHSGKPEQFQSILGLLSSKFEDYDLPSASQKQRQQVAKHFVQRKRGDVERWMGEDTPFPRRDASELPYSLSLSYAKLFNDVLEFAKKLVTLDTDGKPKKAHFWTALGLLRGVMSSPAQGVKMLDTRLEKIERHNESALTSESTLANPISDPDFTALSDIAPTQVLQLVNWTDHQRKKLRNLAKDLKEFENPIDDQKLFAASIVLEDWVERDHSSVVFCRYIETAKYLGRELLPILKKKFADFELRVVTSETPDEIRKQTIDSMSIDKPRILVATDCLSEGVNLQDLFTAVLHYDLPWNPNNLEQREGRVDRFGQSASEVLTCLLYGEDNPIDGVVLDVLLNKVREIRRVTGINVPFPEDSQSIIDTITQSILLSPKRQIHQGQHQLLRQASIFESEEVDTKTVEIRKNLTRKIDEAAEREKHTRGIFAQHAIKAHEIENDLKVVDTAIGNPDAVRNFVTGVLKDVLGVQVIPKGDSYEIIKTNLPSQLFNLLPGKQSVTVSFESPTPKGSHYLGRNHEFVEKLCQNVMSNTIERAQNSATRAAVVRTNHVKIKTTLMLLRCRNVIGQIRSQKRLVAEELILWGWRGTIAQNDHIEHEEAHEILQNARASENLTFEARSSFLKNELIQIDGLKKIFEQLADSQAQLMLESHQRFSALTKSKQYQVVYPVMPMDILGVYVFLP